METIEMWMSEEPDRHPYMSQLAESLGRRGVKVHPSPGQLAALSSLVGRGRPDVYHLHWLNRFFLDAIPPSSDWAPMARARGAVAVLKALKALGVAIVWTAHNNGNHERVAMAADRYLHRRVTGLSDAIIAHSPSAAAEIGEEFDVDASKLRVIPHGHFREWYPDAVDREEARLELGVDGGPVFLFFGQIRPYKNVPSLVRAFRQLNHETAHLVVAGKPVDESVGRHLRQAAGEDARIHLRDEFIPDDEVQYLFRACDAVVLPYRDILTSGTAVLAMSFGRPVIAPDHGPLQDVIGREAGATYDPDAETGGLDQALAWAVGHVDELMARGKQAARRADHWDWESIGAATRALYDDIRQ